MEGRPPLLGGMETEGWRGGGGEHGCIQGESKGLPAARAVRLQETQRTSSYSKELKEGGQWSLESFLTRLRAYFANMSLVIVPTSHYVQWEGWTDQHHIQHTVYYSSLFSYLFNFYPPPSPQAVA